MIGLTGKTAKSKIKKIKKQSTTKGYTMIIKRIDGSIIAEREGTIKEVIEQLVKENISLYKADLSKTNLSWADMSGAYLFKANLSGANLSGADLSYAYLSWADLFKANLSGAFLKINDEKIKITKKPLQIDTGNYIVIIFDNHMKIGCEFHSFKDWFNFSDRKILKMDWKDALLFWNKWKKPLKHICKRR